ncbi:hypothetical protein [Pararhizobium sp. LjRoot238]|uniref:hypothetical protein n=1 Tax=Pararhizobium sp. LjRoot238 TaxID=3342293 RepID=UPI003ECFA86E
MRDGLEAKLDMQDCFSDDDLFDKSGEMREKIAELSQEIEALEQRRSLAEW